MAKTIRMLARLNAGTWAQEDYETAGRGAGPRARELRRLGYAVTVGSIGMQVTPVGSVRITVVTIRPGTHADTRDLPPVESVAW